MVQTVVDPFRVPVVTLSQSEIEEFQEQIALGNLPPDFLERHFEAVRANVFGENYKVDAKGNALEAGRGSPGNQTRQSVDAYRKWGAGDVDYEKNLARLEKELAACESRRAADRAAAPRRRVQP